MLNGLYVAALTAALSFLSAAPATAAGEILITHQAALAGNITPGDQPGYPIHLTRYGVYQLAGPLHPPAGGIGLAVTGADVTIDLNGFRIHGGGAAFHGITGSAENVTIRNGTVAGFRFDGINVAGDYLFVMDMRIVGNGRDGIVCTYGCHIEGSLIAENFGRGIDLDQGTILGNTIVKNGLVGINALFGGTGYGNNTLVNNSTRTAPGPEVSGGVQPLHPNVCNGCP